MASLPVPVGGDRDRGGSLLAMVWTEVSIAIIFVSMRMYSRFKINGTGIEYVLPVSILALSCNYCLSLENCLGQISTHEDCSIP